MDPRCISSDGFEFNQYSDRVNGIETVDPFLDTNYAGNPASLSIISTDEDESDFSDTVLRYINQMLMEEDMEEKPCMFHDSLALQAAEESLYEVIGEKYPSDYSIQHHLHNYHHGESSEESVSGNNSDHSSSGSSANVTTNSFESRWSNIDLTEYKPSLLQATFPANFVFQSSPTSAAQLPMDNMRSFNNSHKYNGFMGTYRTGFSDSTLLSKSESVLQFQRGVEEASKFLPNTSISLSFGKALEVVTKTERDDSEHMPKGRRKSHEREDGLDLEDERSNKQSAIYMGEDEGEQLSALFDKILIGPALGKEAPPLCIFDKIYSPDEPRMSVKPEKNEESNKSGDRKSRVRKQSYKKEVVDLETLLIQCAQAVSSDNRGSANELLKQIRQHSSSVGSGSQRLAHFFANALEARLAGTGTQIYTALSSKRTSAADMVKAYQMYITACPFHKMAIILANHTILHLPSEAETLHIIDFGIRYGFQWPSLIYRFARQHGGLTKLRITGIDLPQPGFRPAERVQETGRRLARFCKRFNVPFEYNGIAQKWETIKVEDLKIKKNELVAVNCLVRFKNLLDETVVVNSPRDAVLNLIRKAQPNIFVQTILNGCYNAPFFVTRFREALFHYSAAFDVLDTTVDAEDPMRLMFEKEFLGREVMNIIACEGCERVERPETYKQWQARNMRAGLRQLPLDPRLINVLREKLRNVYHSDFMLDVDSNWMLQGWKGRIVYASSFWVPA